VTILSGRVPSAGRALRSARRRLAAWRILLGLAVPLVWPLLDVVRVHGQEAHRIDVVVGPTVITASDTIEGSGRGWLTGAYWRATSGLGLAFELSTASRSREIQALVIRERLVAIMAGLHRQWSRGVVRPFVAVLAGATRVDLDLRAPGPIESRATFRETHPTFQAGVGVDLSLRGPLGARIAYDYRRVIAAQPLNQHWLTIGGLYGF